MDASIYLMNRKVDGDHGEPFNQSVAVYAASPEAARHLVALEFARIRKASKGTEHAYQDTPAFDVNKIKLADKKLLTHGVPQWGSTHRPPGAGSPGRGAHDEKPAGTAMPAAGMSGICTHSTLSRRGS